MSAQLQLFGSLPRVRAPRMRWLTWPQKLMLDELALTGGHVVCAGAGSRVRARMLRRLIDYKLIEVSGSNPARFPLTEYGKFTRTYAKVIAR
jgi:hypothetical protein